MRSELFKWASWSIIGFALVAGFAARAEWPNGHKRGFQTLLVQQCRADLPFFNAKQCVSWSKCSVNLLEEAYPTIKEFMTEIQTQKARFKGGAYFVGKVCGARELNKVSRKPQALNKKDLKPRDESLLKIVVRDLKKELQITLFQHVNATGVHKKRLELKINKLQDQLAVILGEKKECV